MKFNITPLRPLAGMMVAVAGLSVQAQTGRLNDTGQTSCYDASDAAVACDTTTTGNAGTRPHQDGRYGRDAAQVANALPAKTGAGAAGFDFTKIANDGTALDASATLGTGTTDWACTRDNVTGLLWEVKTTSGLRSTDHTYTWYSLYNNNDNPGSLGADTCGGTLSAAPYNNQCNTANYVAAVNAAGLCGYTDWRMPTTRELLSFVHNGLASAPFVDPSYFPNTQIYPYWTADTYAKNWGKAWGVFHGSTSASIKDADDFVRLVRSGG